MRLHLIKNLNNATGMKFDISWHFPKFETGEEMDVAGIPIGGFIDIYGTKNRRHQPRHRTLQHTIFKLLFYI